MTDHPRLLPRECAIRLVSYATLIHFFNQKKLVLDAGRAASQHLLLPTLSPFLSARVFTEHRNQLLKVIRSQTLIKGNRPLHRYKKSKIIRTNIVTQTLETDSSAGRDGASELTACVCRHTSVKEPAR